MTAASIIARLNFFSKHIKLQKILLFRDRNLMETCILFMKRDYGKPKYALSFTTFSSVIHRYKEKKLSGTT